MNPQTRSVWAIFASIIDLQRQPTSRSIHGWRYVMIYNGEVYNYEIAINTAFSPALHPIRKYPGSICPKGIECVNDFNGIRPGIWDRQDKRLFIIRDRFGKTAFVINGAMILLLQN
jgi:asparagine synthetase B (glutamine-hydrolysing)